ncbi:MAG: glycosyltransferase family 2 protein [Actinomycetota bacterium]|nr:glycosyltransferase family 2 protein [Actinomycetota bacterium]
MKLLGVVLCYNDADILRDVIGHLVANGHDIIAWDHGSTDGTAQVLDDFSDAIVERRLIPRTFDFYEMYPAMSRHLMQDYVRQYDWISWPDDDEILEGPHRNRSYGDYLAEMADSPYDWIQFLNFNFWVTEEDDLDVLSPNQRIHRYAVFPNCAPRIRSWRAGVTNVREFNHNPLPGNRSPSVFRLRHYPARTYAQLYRRIFIDRANMQRGAQNFHYNGLLANLAMTTIPASALLLDDGQADLSDEPVFDWLSLYSGAAQSEYANRPLVAGGESVARASGRASDGEPASLEDLAVEVARLVMDNDVARATEFYLQHRVRFDGDPMIGQFDEAMRALRADRDSAEQ